MLRAISLSLLLFLFSAGTYAAGPDFVLRGLDGKEHRLLDYRGKWVVVNYWATWCPPCLEEIPELIRFHEQHIDKDAVVLGVNMEDVDVEYLSNFVDENFISYPVLLKESRMTTVGPVPGLPTTYIVAPDGRVAARKVGQVTAEGLDAFIKGNQ